MSNWKNAVTAAPVARETEIPGIYSTPGVHRGAPSSQIDLRDRLEAAIKANKISERNRGFALSLLHGFWKWSRFTEKQLPHVERLVKAASAPVAPAAPAVKFTKLVTWFDYLTDNIKYPKLHLTVDGRELKISRAGAGHLNLTEGKPFGQNQWYGRVNRDGSFVLGKDGRVIETQLYAFLAELEANPREVCRKYGLDTGNCACCGRLLTNEGSIELGIGPICAEKFGF